MNVTHEQISDGLKRAHYVTNERVETAIFLALALEKPLLIEGPACAGKTEVAKVLAEILHTELIRLQCYEGLDEARALYEWNYQKQLLRIQADRQDGRPWEGVEHDTFSGGFPPPRAAAAARGRVAPARRPPDRRGRQGGPGVRGLPARGAERVPGERAGAG